VIRGGVALTNVSGGTLGGTGTINTSVFISDAGLAIGASVGKLTISGNLTLSDLATTTMKVSHSAADQFAGMSSVGFGGTLTVTLAGPITGGEVFQLFAAGSYSGDFGAYNLPA